MPKRIFDLVFCSLIFILSFPLLLFCALVVKISSRGPIFYAHLRIGRNGKPFECLKFRTMYQNADTKLQPLLASDPALMREWQMYFKLKKDPRVTPIGRLLRRTSLDELPQIWNVLKGEMSIVGPRPMTEEEVHLYLGSKGWKILSLRPGLTTLWITRGRNQLSMEQRVALEEFYVANRSFWLDCKLIIRTIFVVLFPKGAY